MSEAVDWDTRTLMNRLDSIETRLRKLEEALMKRGVVLLEEVHISSVKKAADHFLALSEKVKGRWKGSLTAVEEVRKMRKHHRGY